MPRSLLILRMVIACLVLGPTLTGCLLMSDRAEQSTITPENGSQVVSFYSSDTNGSAVEQKLELSTSAERVEVTFSARVEAGELRIEVLNGQEGEVVLTLDATKEGASVTGIVRTNDVGDLRYRLRTSNARNGEYRIRYVPPPTPTPTPPPTTTPQPTATPVPTATATPTVEPTVELTATP
jgi:hypothetical protein